MNNREELRGRGELEEAYRATGFWVEHRNGRFCLRDGRRSAELDRILVEDQRDSWAYITACNPHSRCLSPEENQRRMRKLESVIQQSDYSYYRGEGVGDGGNWKPEPSLLVVGIVEAEACDLARRFDQNSVLVGHRAKAARLVWTGPDASPGELG